MLENKNHQEQPYKQLEINMSLYCNQKQTPLTTSIHLSKYVMYKVSKKHLITCWYQLVSIHGCWYQPSSHWLTKSKCLRYQDDSRTTFSDVAGKNMHIRWVVFGLVVMLVPQDGTRGDLFKRKPWSRYRRYVCRYVPLRIQEIDSTSTKKYNKWFHSSWTHPFSMTTGANIRNFNHPIFSILKTTTGQGTIRILLRAISTLKVPQYDEWL